MMEVLSPFCKDEADLGNMLEIRRQDYGQLGICCCWNRQAGNRITVTTYRTHPCLVTFPAFRQVRDSQGEPTQGRYDQDIYVHKVDDV